MNAIRVKELWELAGVHYVRTEAMIKEFDVTLDREFKEDTSSSNYVLVFDENRPVSTCRVVFNKEKGYGKIERVASVSNYRNKGAGRLAILEAEKWIKDMGFNKVLINAREEVIGFYEKLGYVPTNDEKTGSGRFVCVMTQKKI